ncbi:MAG TPA: amidohydrolase family protein [Bacillota bacterium]|nr:amidohydrolase family protein [Bacillota bacterium]
MSGYVLRGRVIDGICESSLDDGMVVIEGDRICHVGPYDRSLISDDACVIEVKNGTVMPGFIDSHAHLCGFESAGDLKEKALFGDLLLGSAYEVGILLDAGFTGVRDMSRNGLYLSRAVEHGILRGPRIMPGGRVLGITSGHIDPGGVVVKEQANRTSSIAYLVDGVDECLYGVREQFREGAQFIKICATGGVSSPVDRIDDVQFSFEEINVMVEEATRHGTYVTAHCTSATGAYQALKAGVRCIEHGVMLDQKCIDIMAQHDITLVSTLSVSLGVANIPDLPDYMAQKVRRCAEANIRTIEMARKAGIRIALGTDYGNTPNSRYAENGREFEAMTRAGMTPMEAIRAGTVNGAYLMNMADKIGTLERGKLADVVIVEGNPLEDINCLCHKDRVKVVFKNGVLEKHIA